MIRTLDSNGLLLSSTEHMIGLGAHGTGSSNATHPAAIFGPGGRPAGNVIVAERVVQGATIHTYWRCEDQLNSCIGQIDENGWRAFQNSYLAFGEALQSRVLFDGAMARWSSIDTDTPGPGQSTITLDDSITLTADSLNGALLYLARPGEAVDRHMETNVVDTTSGTIIIDDPSGDFAAALAEATGDPSHFAPPINDFVIFAFNDSKVPNAPTYQTQGTWTTGPTTGSGKTKFTDAEADDNGGGFASWMVGCLLVPDVNIGAPLVIVNVSSATEVEVSGTATGVGSNGSRYLIYAAPFTDPVHGTLQTDAHKTGTRYLWAGYRYQPPQIGFWVNPGAGFGVYGAATGSNRLGQYYAWNRIYDINTGRWTSPDPVATPWWNLQDYLNGKPTRRTDPTGLTGGPAGCFIGVAIGAVIRVIEGLATGHLANACEWALGMLVDCLIGTVSGGAHHSWKTVLEVAKNLGEEAGKAAVALLANLNWVKDICERAEKGWESRREEEPEYPELGKLLGPRGQCLEGIGGLADGVKKIGEIADEIEKTSAEASQKRLEKARRDIGDKKPHWFDASKEYPEGRCQRADCEGKCIGASPWYVGRELAQAYCENACTECVRRQAERDKGDRCR